MNSLDLKVLHALVVEHLLRHPPLRRPVEEDVDEQQDANRNVEAGEALPTDVVKLGVGQHSRGQGDRLVVLLQRFTKFELC
jgi:hypothetical protein